MSVNIHINSPNVRYTDTHITAQYSYQTASVHREGENVTVNKRAFLASYCAQMQPRHLHSNFAPCGKQVSPRTTEMTFRTEKHVPRLGVMLVGWGGNNGTTVTAAVLANKLGLTWRTNTGVKVSGLTKCAHTWISRCLHFIQKSVKEQLGKDNLHET